MASSSSSSSISNSNSNSSSSSSSNNNNDIIHLVLFPLMAQGHILPMLDIAKLLTQQNPSILITIFITPQNATHFQNSHLIHIPQIHFAILQVQTTNDLPSSSTLNNQSQLISFFSSLAHLHPQALALCQALTPKPTAIISDLCLPWTLQISSNLGIPWISFSGGSCFGSVVMAKINSCHHYSESDIGDHQYFEVPGLLGDHRIEITKAQLPTSGLNSGMLRFLEEIAEAESKAHGMIVNSFEELEGFYVGELKKMKKIKGLGDRVWCVGPVSLSNQLYLHQAQRGKASTKDDDDNNNKNNKNEEDMMKWLDSQERNSVVYVCLGSIHNLKTPQLIELALGLESSNKPFIWVVRGSKKLEKWIEKEGFEERIGETRLGVIIKDWAPQLLILSHPSIGGFLTHCGWNSILEGIAAGLPMLTWPLFSDQFLNEKFVVNVLNIALKIGAQFPVMKMKEDQEEDQEEEIIMEVMIKKEDIKEGIERLMGKLGDELADQERRKKATELGILANNALEKGGSSHLNIQLFIHDIVKLVNKTIST